MASVDIAKTPEEYTPPKMLMLGGLVAFVIGLIGFGIEFAVADAADAWSTFLLGAFFANGVALFGLFFIAFHTVANASWHVALRRVPAAMAAYLIPSAVLFLIFLGGAVYGSDLYEWMHVEDYHGHHAHLLHGKEPWLNPEFFAIRVVIYFLIWIVFYKLIIGQFRKQDETGDIKHTGRAMGLSAVFCMLFALTVSFSSFDWLMSLQATWFSTMYGVYMFSGMFSSGIAMIAIVLFIVQKTGGLKGIVNENHYHSLAQWLISSVVFWGYIWFSQFLLIWYTNIPEETQHYFGRWESGWFWIQMVAAPFFCFLLPFLMLLPRPNKRNTKILLATCVVVLIGRFIDLWMAIEGRVFFGEDHLPTADSPGFPIFEILSFVGFGGLLVAATFWALGRSPIFPKKDPFLEESAHHHI